MVLGFFVTFCNSLWNKEILEDGFKVWVSVFCSCDCWYGVDFGWGFLVRGLKVESSSSG